MVNTKKQDSIIFAVILTLMLVLLNTTCANAATKTAKDYHVFTGSVPNVGSYVAWGINLKVEGTYTTSSSSYTLNTIEAQAYMTPKQPPNTGDGRIIATISETIDYGTRVNRNISPNPSSFWYNISEIWGASD